MQVVTSFILSAFTVFGVTTIQSSICEPLSDPTITSPTSGEVEAGSTFVTGTADFGSTVALQVNSQTAATTTADINDSFGLTISLSEGQRTLRVVASDPCASKASAPVELTVIDSSEPSPNPTSPTAPEPTPTPSPSPGENQPLPSPSDSEPDNEENTGKFKLTVDPVLDGSTVDTPSVYVSGFLSHEGTVVILVDGTVVAELKASDRVFGFRVPLQMGENLITIRAKSGGTSAEKSITITRVPVGQPTTANTANDEDTTEWYESPLAYMIGVAALVIIGTASWLVVSGRWLLKPPRDF